MIGNRTRRTRCSHRIKLTFLQLATLVFAASATLGCYSFRGQVAGDIKSIAIRTLENESTEFGLGEIVTDELVRAFQKDGLLRITTESQADAILSGRIVRVDDQPYTARPGETITVEEYRFALTCELELTDNRRQASLWRQVFPAWAIYPYSGSLENRAAAIDEAVNKLKEDLLNKIVGSW